MSTPSAEQPIDLAIPPVTLEVPAIDLETMKFERSHFINSLIEHGLISQEFAARGVLDQFELDPKTGQDRLMHTLIGNEQGGLHHLPTVIGLEIPGRIVAGVIQDPANPDKPARKHRQAQRVRASGAYRAKHVEIVGRDGFTYQKSDGSSMFPDEWSTQQVLEAILTSAATEPYTIDLTQNVSKHTATIDGVPIHTVTNAETGKIITSAPVMRT